MPDCNAPQSDHGSPAAATTGLVLVHERLEGCKFVWPQVRNGVLTLSPSQFSALFEGIDWRMVRPEAERRPTVAG
ncbi:MAG: hypothetical protein CML24_00905 [Rhizobiales bacterium]|nr:hypothetical protein [Hyphomicrobiales bacterium]